MKTPGSPSKQRKDINPDRLQIRIVPYSPPRLSTEESASSCPISSAAFQPSGLPSAQDQTDHGDFIGAYGSNLPVKPSLQTALGTDLKCVDGVNSAISAESANIANLNSDQVEEFPSLSQASPSPSYRRAKRVISVNSDKTFSLLPHAYPPSSATDSTRSPRRPSTGPSSSNYRTVSDSFAEERSSSPLATLQELPQPCFGDDRPLPSSKSQFQEAPSPWNYQLVGGLRKVPKSPSKDNIHVLSNDILLDALCLGSEMTAPDLSHGGPCQVGNLTLKQSFHSYKSTSTMSEATNYKTFRHDSPCPKQTKRSMMLGTVDLEKMSDSSRQPNIEVGEISSEPSSDDRSRPRTSESNCNYILHQDVVSSSPIGPASASRLKREYSRESLVVAPLRPRRKHVVTQTSFSRPGSRDSLKTGPRRASSGASFEYFADKTTVLIPSGGNRQPSNHGAIAISSENSYVKPSHPQHRTALSSAVSKNEGDTEVLPPHFSPSGLGKLHHEDASHAHGLSRDLDVRQSETWIYFPQPAHFKNWTPGVNSSSLRLIEDQDEHRDGLAELGVLHRHPSRTKLHSYLSSFPSDRNLRSAGTSRSNSFIHSYIPTWARLYYGSGERRLLSIRQSSDSLYSNFSARAHRSMTVGSATFQISSPVKQTYHHRQMSVPIDPSSSAASNTLSDNAVSIPGRRLSIIRKIRKQTSSIWSPHLRRDKRAPMSRLWRPPSVESIGENRLLRDRIQAMLFVLGFVFPFAWIAASFLPLPSYVGAGSGEKVHSTSHLDLEQGNHVKKEFQVRASSSHEREKWWRALNRYMSIIGVFVIGAVLALTITGTQQQWKS